MKPALQFGHIYHRRIRLRSAFVIASAMPTRSRFCTPEYLMSRNTSERVLEDGLGPWSEVQGKRTYVRYTMNTGSTWNSLTISESGQKPISIGPVNIAAMRTNLRW